MKYWLMKSEPEVFSIDHLKKDSATWWTGVRNYQARNSLKEMALGDQVLFYHSSCDPPGIAGVAIVSKTAKADETQFDKKSDFFDPKALKKKPIWFCPEVKFQSKFKKFIALDDLRSEKKLAAMLVLKRGQRLSVQPVSKEHFDIVVKMGSN